jgi:hypothetical protein
MKHKSKEAFALDRCAGQHIRSNRATGNTITDKAQNCVDAIKDMPYLNK